MFPIRSGRDPVNTPNLDQVLYQKLTASALHEIGKRAIIDASLLYFHHQAAEVYHRKHEKLPIPENLDGSYALYTSQQAAGLRADLINVVMKFHILDEQGLAHQLTPLIQALSTNSPLSPQDAANPFLQRVLNNHRSFSLSIEQVLREILNFDSLENIDGAEAIRASYNYDVDDTVNVAVWEDNTVQCACNFCEGFFQIMSKAEVMDRSTLNPIQQQFLRHYHF